MQNQTLRDILMDALEVRGLTVERLAELTNIPERYLVALRDNDAKKLPAAPYIRGYLMKIGNVLEIDGRNLWEIYKRQNPLRTSGIGDRLPANRFVIKRLNPRYFILGFVAIAVIIYLVWRGGDFFGTPRINISSPAINNFVVKDSRIKLSGEINSKDKLTINGEEIIVAGNGYFEKDFSLEPGVNTVEFKVKRFLGKEITVTRQIIYQP